MILLLNSQGPVTYTFRNEVIRACVAPFTKLRHRRLLRGGPRRVAKNLRTELSNSNKYHWRECYRDQPSNESIDVIWVLNDTADLQWAITNKGAINARELWAGPNLVVVPGESSGIVTSPEIDRCLVPCEWVADLYLQHAPSLSEKIAIWPVGIDTDEWQPKRKVKSRILIYNKNQDALALEISRWLTSIGQENKILIYGHYAASQYVSELDQAKGMIWLSEAESQGLALLEAMSMNVPALVWDAHSWHYFSKELQENYSYIATSAPYFDETCGYRFKDFDELKRIFKSFEDALFDFEPRKFIFNNLLSIKDNLTIIDSFFVRRP